jgi:hypothetical protein
MKLGLIAGLAGILAVNSQEIPVITTQYLTYYLEF